MPSHLFILSKEDLGLAQAEAEALHGAKGERHDDLLLLDVDAHEEGLAFTRSIHEILWEGDETGIDSITLDVACPFLVRTHDLPFTEQELAAHIWHAIERVGKKPSVSLENPCTEIHVFSLDGRIILTRLVWRNTERFSERRPHLRPRNHPTGLSPKLARAMVNLAGKTKSILDPFCGAGGILLEGALASREMTGTDIDQRQIERAEENLAYYGIGAFLSVHDARSCDTLGRFDAIVTDLPLGKNAKLDDAGIFADFFVAAAKSTAVMVLGLDAGWDLDLAPWKLAHEFTWSLHRGMAKRVLLLRAPRSS